MHLIQARITCTLGAKSERTIMMTGLIFMPLLEKIHLIMEQLGLHGSEELVAATTKHRLTSIETQQAKMHM